LVYPQSKPANVENSLYWAKVKFGLKPTLRVVHMVTMGGNPGDPVAYAIAEKQLYSSHFFETALDLAVHCVRDSSDPKQLRFYLIMVLGSKQAGLTGAKRSIVRRTAVGRSVSHLQTATTIKVITRGSVNQTLAGRLPANPGNPQPTSIPILDEHKAQHSCGYATERTAAHCRAAIGVASLRMSLKTCTAR